MTDLTEQWKKGELPEGHYYIKTRNEINIDEYIQWYKDHGIPSEKSFAYFKVQQVIAPVPSCDEWQSSYNCMLENEVLRLKNAQLKELLKECKEVIKNVDTYYGNYDSTNGYLVITKIDEALR